MKSRHALVASLWLAVMAATVGTVHAQSQRETERKLERLRGELRQISQERRKLEGERGDASRQLRTADEKVGRTSRSLSETEAAIKREEEALATLQQQRDELGQGLERQREQLASLVRSAYMLGDDAPLKVLLAQDRISDVNRALAYQRYVQRDRAQKIAAINGDLQALEEVERDIEARRMQLQVTLEQQRAQVSALEKDRKARAAVVSELDQRYRDRSAREKALGQDTKALERLLANLRAAAARAEAERRAAAKREQGGGVPAGKSPSPRPPVATAPPLKVGGLGWPVSGSLLARFGGRMPDGRTSSGVLIGAPVGSTVTAVADGSVVFSEWMTGYGLILIVDHGNGYMSLYAHNDALLRDTGDTVKRGEAIAKVGGSGGQGTPALYFELRRNGQPVDPSSWLQRR